jgi:tetratricopeptide (TPR) repeat protein
MNSKRIGAARFRVYIIVTTIAALLGTASATGLIPQYNAAEAPRHVGERATVVGKVECISAGRTFHSLELDGCSPNSPFWIIFNDDASGPELNVQDLKGVTIAVTGQIEKRDVYSHPWMVVKSTTQIQPRRSLNTDYISRAHQKGAAGDTDGAIEMFGRAIEHQADRRNEAYEFRGRAKERKGDWNGALNDYDALVALDPNNANSYYIRATQKKQHGDFEGAMADFTRAAALRSSPNGFTAIGDLRKERGDLAGAVAEYDKAIALCDKQLADPSGTADTRQNAYYQRAYAKQLKGDMDGANADFTRAIAINPAHAAGAYNGRGDVRKAKGDLAGAIADYQRTVELTHHPIYKEKLDKTRAEAKAGAKKVVVTQPSTQAAQNEQFSNKDEVSPESIAEAFVQAYSGTDVDALASLYADRVDHINSGMISNATVRAQAKEYFTRWPVRQWSPVGPVKTISLGATKQKVIFSASYDASDPQTNKHASGISQETLILASDKSGAMKIVSQKEQTSKGSSGQSGSKPISAEVVDIPELQAEFGIKAGNVKVTFSDGHTAVWTHSGDCQNAKVSPKGNVGWIRIAKRETLSPSGKTIALNNDSLVVHLIDGTTKKFPPFGENHFIPDWRFAEDDKAVIVRSGGYHGPASYVQYDLASGKVIDSRGSGYTPYAQLPAWAKPLADPNE